MSSEPTEKQSDVPAGAPSVTLPHYSQIVGPPVTYMDTHGVYWVKMPDGANLCLRKCWVPGTSTSLGSWVWELTSQHYPSVAV